MTIFNIEKFNIILEKHNQLLKAITITGTQIELSNGNKITNIAEIRKCKRRVMNNSVEYIRRFDVIYGMDINKAKVALTKAKSLTSRKGGLNCQKKHKIKIRKNLNNGIPWNKGIQTQHAPWNKGLTKDSDSRLKLLSVSRTGPGNPMFGVKHSTEYKQAQSVRMKEAIKNGSFTPNSNNRNTHWNAYYNGLKFRSSWEALYQAIDPTAEYESLRIEYRFKEKNHIYIVDFVNHLTKIAVEVKPKELCKDAKTQAKLTALKDWCNIVGYTFILADQTFLANSTVDMTLFDDCTKNKIEKLYETQKKKSNT